ncbi:MAG TPA: hypothetical protein VHJ78_01220 [Actinomycetota bacterium]|nr:hypothetical protein [Actinomycetota bacterium]
MPKPSSTTCSAATLRWLVALSGALGSLAPVQAAAGQQPDLIAVEEPSLERTITGMAPGDSVSMALTVRNVSGQPLDLAVRVDGPVDSDLMRDREAGLLVQVERCAEPWNSFADPATGAPVFRCNGQTDVVLPTTPLGRMGADLPVDGLRLQPGERASYRAMVTLSPQADNRYRELSLGTLRLVADATAGDRSDSETVTVRQEVLGAEEGPRGGLPAIPVRSNAPAIGLLAMLFLAGGLSFLWFAIRQRRREEHE